MGKKKYLNMGKAYLKGKSIYIKTGKNFPYHRVGKLSHKLKKK